MQIQFERTGGFAGMRVSTAIDTDTLSHEDANELQGLVESCDFFNLPPSIQGSGGGADRFQYNITINSEGRQHSVEASEDAAPQSLKALLRRLTTLARSGGGS